MKVYDYRSEIYHDIIRFLEENFNENEYNENGESYLEDMEEWASRAQEVTGEDGGGYWAFNEDAAKCVFSDDNINLYLDARKKQGLSSMVDLTKFDPIDADVAIRKYLFNKYFDEALKDFLEENIYND